MLQDHKSLPITQSVITFKQVMMTTLEAQVRKLAVSTVKAKDYVNARNSKKPISIKDGSDKENLHFQADE